MVKIIKTFKVESVLFEDLKSLQTQYPKIDENTFNKLISLDPTYREGSNSAGKFAKWLLTKYNKGIISEKDFGHIPDVLQLFVEKQRVLDNKDIGSYKTLQDVEDACMNADDDNLSDRQKLRDREKLDKKLKSEGNDIEVIYDDRTYRCLIPKTWEASTREGDGSSWCTASKEGRQWYDRYTAGGPLFLIQENGEPLFQFHIESDSYMDKDDISVDAEEIRKHVPNSLLRAIEDYHGRDVLEIETRDGVDYLVDVHPYEWTDIKKVVSDWLEG